MNSNCISCSASREKFEIDGVFIYIERERERKRDGMTTINSSEEF